MLSRSINRSTDCFSFSSCRNLSSAVSEMFSCLPLLVLSWSMFLKNFIASLISLSSCSGSGYVVQPPFCRFGGSGKMSSPAPERVTTWRFFEFKISCFGTVCKRFTFLLFITFSSTIGQSSSEWSPTPQILQNLRSSYVFDWEIWTDVVVLPTVEAVISSSTSSSTEVSSSSSSMALVASSTSTSVSVSTLVDILVDCLCVIH
jgi:hypothetical protein